MCGLHVSSCFGAAGTLVGEAGPWPGWLRGLATTVVGIWGWSTRAGATLEEQGSARVADQVGWSESLWMAD